MLRRVRWSRGDGLVYVQQDRRRRAGYLPVRHGARHHSAGNLRAQRPQDTRLRPADAEGGRGRRRQGAGRDPAARAARQGRREEGRDRHQGLRRLPQLRRGRRRQGRPRSLRRRRSREGVRRRVRLFVRLEGKGRQVDVRRPQRVADVAVEIRVGHQDGLRRRGGREEARRHHRLPALAGEGSGAAAEADARGREAGGRRRRRGQGRREDRSRRRRRRPHQDDRRHAARQGRGGRQGLRRLPQFQGRRRQ